MEFSRYTDERNERLDQIATQLCEIYGDAPERLPRHLREQLEKLKRIEAENEQRS